jgi:predicted metalloprotease with PDZ domain
MTRYPLILAVSAVTVAGVAALGLRSALAQPATTAADTAKREADQASLEAQLEAARKQLEAAAHRVAELSAQLSRPVIERFMDFDWDMWDEHGRAIIGVQLDPAPDGPGARVRGVSPGGPAAEAGIRAGDVIVAVNGTEVKGENPARQVMRLMREVKPDSKVSVRVLRDGSPHDYAVVAREGPNFVFEREGVPGLPGPELMPGSRGPLVLIHGPVMDMELATLTPQLGRYFGSDKGVLVVRAPADGALKLEDGDVILAIDGREPASGSHATRILASYQPGEKLTLRVVRLHKTFDIETTLPERAGRRHAASGTGHTHGAAPLPPPAPLPRLAPGSPGLPPLPPTPGSDKVTAMRGIA